MSTTSNEFTISIDADGAKTTITTLVKSRSGVVCLNDRFVQIAHVATSEAWLIEKVIANHVANARAYNDSQVALFHSKKATGEI